MGKNMIAAAGGAMVAEMVTIPIDQSKVRLQLQKPIPGVAPEYTGMLQTIAKIAQKEGVGSLYRGLTPGLQRQMINCSIRFGCYENVRNAICGDLKGQPPPLSKKILAAAITGCVSILFANPTDVVKVRMQAISKNLQEGEKMPLTRQVYSDILKNEGIGGFWQGIQPNIARNCMINIGEMASYDQYKQLFLTYTPIRDGAFLHFLCGAASGFTATIIGSPFDVVKTRLMSDPHAYPGVVSAFTTMAKQEGLLVFYQGFIPNFIRLCSWTVVMFMSMEQIKAMLYRNVH